MNKLLSPADVFETPSQLATVLVDIIDGGYRIQDWMIPTLVAAILVECPQVYQVPQVRDRLVESAWKFLNDEEVFLRWATTVHQQRDVRYFIN